MLCGAHRAYANEEDGGANERRSGSCHVAPGGKWRRARIVTPDKFGRAIGSCVTYFSISSLAVIVDLSFLSGP